MPTADLVNNDNRKDMEGISREDEDGLFFCAFDSVPPIDHAVSSLPLLCLRHLVFPSLIGIAKAYLCEGHRGHLAQIPLTAPQQVIFQPPLDPHPQGQGALCLAVLLQMACFYRRGNGLGADFSVLTS